MARVTSPLTNTEVKQAKPKAKEYNLADGKGLYLRVKPIGSKLWLFNYSRPFTKKRANISLGTFPAFSLANARRKSEEMRELLAQSIDPKHYKDEQSRKAQDAHSNTLERVFAKWLETKKSKVSAGYAQDIERSFDLHIAPKLGKVPIHLIKAKDTIDIFEPIAAKGALETVKRLCQRLNEVMVYATNTGLLDSNSLSGIQKAFDSPKKNNMPTLAPAEMPTLMKAISNANLKRTTRCLIEWQLHTMTRPSEAAGARWDEIDLIESVWQIPEERMKKRRSHSVPLTPQTISILETMKPISGHREFIFPSDRNPKSHINSQTANMAIKRMGFGGLLVAHGMRALASTTLNENGFDSDVIEAALAHSDKNEVRGAYNRAEYLERRKGLMVWWSDQISYASNETIESSNNVKYLSPSFNKKM
jgi:integrase